MPDSDPLWTSDSYPFYTPELSSNLAGLSQALLNIVDARKSLETLTLESFKPQEVKILRIVRRKRDATTKGFVLT